jgi:hypothetical protein
MTDPGHLSTDAGSSRATHGEPAVPEPTAWTGWIAFSGFMMILLGTFQAIEGLVAVFDDGFYRVRPDGLLVNVDYNVWGWVHLLLGVVVVLSGLGVLVGNLLARIVGVVLAVVSAVLNLAFISAYPVWSTIVIAVDVVVIYALTVHGREMRRVDAGY